VLVLRDISDHVRLRQRVSQAEKLASLGQFIAGIAHEMNNPLQSVLGHLELMLDEKDHDAAHRTELRRAFHDADRAAKIVRNLLVFSGSQRVVRRRVSVEKLLARVIAMREVALHRNEIPLDRQGQLDLPEIIGDTALLQQALLNVLINAEQAIGERTDGHITLTTSVEGNMVVIAVADNGTGIHADVLPRIFDPFFTTKDVGQGTGLGLAITYGIVQEHGGTITAASTGSGAVFTFHLPVAE
jgi:two-component system, NtrC family, sensor kinase